MTSPSTSAQGYGANMGEHHSEKKTPTKSHKVITPNKKRMRLDHEPSPVKNVDKMCKTLKQEKTKLKNEISEMFRRFLSAGNVQQIGELLLDNRPLLKLYELYLEVKLDTTNKDQEGGSSYIPLLIPDSSTRDV
ncbi:hypothetical protein SASPL_105807 [Salvia splendens]|uniref:Uncharacterized protein n=1 Tax=Salvia splendens TaxID=180675 RepID=A0A8X8YM35_SALSN|nr:hypothetical protein SASPL_105807 [Salvia splendens]